MPGAAPGKTAKSKKYLWLAIAIVAVEMSILLVKSSRTYRHEAANADLIEAIAHCQPAGVQAALKRGADAARDLRPQRSFLRVVLDTLQPAQTVSMSSFNSSPLSCALSTKPIRGMPMDTFRANRLKIVSALLDHGASPNGHSGYDYSPLYLAVSSDDVALTQTLLDHGARATEDSVPSAMGLTSPVLFAAACKNICGDPAIVNLLLAHGAGIDTVSIGGQSALMVAAQLGDLNMVAFLVSHGARTDLKDHGGHTAADLVPRHGIPAVDRERLITLLRPPS